MKISRRSVLRYSGLTAALLALTGCSASPGSAILGGDLPDWMKSLFCGSAASSSASSEAAASSVVAASEAAAGEAAASSAASSEAASSAFSLLPAYDADPLTGEAQEHRPMVGVMVNNIANSEKQNARPQRGIGSADLLIESKVEGGITACVPCSGMRTPSRRSGRCALAATSSCSCSCPIRPSITTMARAFSAPSSSMYTITPA